MIGNTLRGRGSWIWLALSLIVLGLLSLVSTNSGHSRALAAGSASPSGALALRLWLDRVGYRVTVASTGHESAALPGRGTLMLLAGGSDASDADVPSFLAWVQHGGHLVIATDGGTGNRVVKSLGLRLVPAGEDAPVVTQPLLLAPPVKSLFGTTATVVQQAARNAPAAETSFGPVLVRVDRGRGVIWLLTAPELLDNGHIAHADNRKLALNLAGAAKSAVVIDEYQPPVTAGSAADWLTNSVWGVAILFGLAVAVLFRWLSGWRLGPAVVPLSDRHRAATEYVISLAGLLQRGKSREAVLAIYQRSLRRAAQFRYGNLEHATLDAGERESLERLLRPAASLSERDLIKRAAAIVEQEEIMRKRHG